MVDPPRFERGTWGSKPRELPLLQGSLNGGTGGARTRDSDIKSIVLFQLSYNPLLVDRRGLGPRTPCLRGTCSNQLS